MFSLRVLGMDFYLVPIVFGSLGLGGSWQERFLWKTLVMELQVRRLSYGQNTTLKEALHDEV